MTEGLIEGDRKRERGREAQGLRTGTDKELNPKQTMSHDSLSTCQQVHALPLLCDSGMHLRFVHSGHFGRGEEAPFSTRSLPYSTLARKLPRWLGDKSSWQCRGLRFDPWLGKLPWRRKWQLTAIFLPGGSHGQRSLVGYNPQGCKESDTT